jgi:Response regulator containing CheY-like receiver domain and AraC-type DNA-binding domain
LFKVLIVDDEAIIRKGLKNIIDWNNYNCYICGEASDGIEGMELIKAEKPDIIITDIRMPEIDGLDMIKNTREIIPNCKIIILTGYRDFDYLQKAIKIGAFDYILKPSKVQDIITVLKKSVEELEKLKKKEAEIEKIKKSLEDKIPELKQKLLYDIIFNLKTDLKNVEEELKLYKINFNEFVIILVENKENDYNAKEDNQLYRIGVLNTFSDVFSDSFGIHFITLSEEKLIFILQPNESKIEIMEKIYEKIDAFNEIVAQFFNIKVAIGVSGLGVGVYELSARMKEAEEALYFNATTNNTIEEDNKVYLESHDLRSDTLSITIKKAMDYIEKNYNKHITLNVLSEQIYISSSYLSRIFANELGKNFVDYLNEVRIEKAKAYLCSDNYKTYEVADMVGIKDAHYFSKIFKKYTGLTPSEYRGKYIN